MKVDVVGVWHGKDLFWLFSLGVLSHEISDRDLQAWIRNESGLDSTYFPHDGILRARHTDLYIEKCILTYPKSEGR